MYISHVLKGFKSSCFLFMLVIIGWFLVVSGRLRGHDHAQVHLTKYNIIQYTITEYKVYCLFTYLCFVLFIHRLEKCLSILPLR